MPATAGRDSCRMLFSKEYYTYSHCCLPKKCGIIFRFSHVSDRFSCKNPRENCFWKLLRVKPRLPVRREALHCIALAYLSMVHGIIQSSISILAPIAWRYRVKRPMRLSFESRREGRVLFLNRKMLIVLAKYWHYRIITSAYIIKKNTRARACVCVWIMH